MKKVTLSIAAVSVVLVCSLCPYAGERPRGLRGDDRPAPGTPSRLPAAPPVHSDSWMQDFTQRYRDALAPIDRRQQDLSRQITMPLDQRKAIQEIIVRDRKAVSDHFQKEYASHIQHITGVTPPAPSQPAYHLPPSPRGPGVSGPAGASVVPGAGQPTVTVPAPPASVGSERFPSAGTPDPTATLRDGELELRPVYNDKGTLVHYDVYAGDTWVGGISPDGRTNLIYSAYYDRVMRLLNVSPGRPTHVEVTKGPLGELPEKVLNRLTWLGRTTLSLLGLEQSTGKTPPTSQGRSVGSPPGQSGSVSPKQGGPSRVWSRFKDALVGGATGDSRFDAQAAKLFQERKDLGLPMDQIRSWAYGTETRQDRHQTLIESLSANLVEFWARSRADSAEFQAGKTTNFAMIDQIDQFIKDARHFRTVESVASSISSFLDAASLLKSTAQFATAKTDQEQKEGAWKMLSEVIPGGGMAWEIGQVLGGQ